MADGSIPSTPPTCSRCGKPAEHAGTWALTIPAKVFGTALRLRKTFCSPDCGLRTGVDLVKMLLDVVRGEIK